MIPHLLPNVVNLLAGCYKEQPKIIWGGRRPRDWANTLAPGLGVEHRLPENPLSRAELRAIWSDKNNCVETCALATMAWGGMRAGHGRKAWAAREHWLPVCQELRLGKYDRKQAYQAFAELRKAEKLPSIGPAYFTKFLFFGMPDQTAYILDQWTARSIHLLTGQDQLPVVKKDYASAGQARANSSKLRLIVADQNSADAYEAYCLAVERLGHALGVTSHEAEEMIFSAGRPNIHPWRDYVCKEWFRQLPAFYI